MYSEAMKKLLLLVTSVAFITSCGGGGGGGGGESSVTPAPTPAPSNSAPTITNATSSYSVLENQTGAFSVSANDTDGDALSYSLSGSDAAKLSINTSGVLTFISAPDHEIAGDSDSNNIYSITVNVSDGTASASKEFAITVTNDVTDDSPNTSGQNNPNFECNKPYYLAKPDPVDSDAAYRYYEYYWQSNPKICVEIREPELIDDAWETRIVSALSYASDNLGIIAPLTAFIVDQKNASQETLTQLDRDWCRLFTDGTNLENCAANQDSWGNRSAAAGVNFESLFNGAELNFFKDVWTPHTGEDNQIGIGIRILMHEYYHTYQNSMKFYFEDKQRFGIRVQWEDDRNNYRYTNEFVTTFPGWVEEGGAEFAGWALATKFIETYDQTPEMIAHLDEARAVIANAAANGDTVSLKDYEYQARLFESTDNPNNGIARDLGYNYTGGFMAYVYLWSLDDANYKKIMVDYYKNYAEKDNLNPGQGWKDSFEDLFGSMDAFYADFDAWMLLDRDTHIAAIKTMELWRSASWD